MSERAAGRPRAFDTTTRPSGSTRIDVPGFGTSESPQATHRANARSERYCVAAGSDQLESHRWEVIWRFLGSVWTLPRTSVTSRFSSVLWAPDPGKFDFDRFIVAPNQETVRSARRVHASPKQRRHLAVPPVHSNDLVSQPDSSPVRWRAVSDAGHRWVGRHADQPILPAAVPANQVEREGTRVIPSHSEVPTFWIGRSYTNLAPVLRHRLWLPPNGGNDHKRRAGQESSHHGFPAQANSLSRNRWPRSGIWVSALAVSSPDGGGVSTLEVERKDSEDRTGVARTPLPVGAETVVGYPVMMAETTNVKSFPHPSLRAPRLTKQVVANARRIREVPPFKSGFPALAARSSRVQSNGRKRRSCSPVRL